MIKIAPSLMCADLTRLGDHVKELEEAGVDLFHFDIMDGHFVNNLTLSPMILAAIRSLTKVPIEVHFMVTNPETFFEQTADAGADMMTVHIEVSSKPYQLLGRIKALGCAPALAINPATPLCFLEHVLPEVSLVVIMTVDPGFAGQEFVPAAVPKIRQLRQMIGDMGLDIEIMVDGHINEETIPAVVEAGADILVLGTSGLFGKPGSLSGNVQAMRKLAASVQRA